MRALGFDVKKAEVLKVMADATRDDSNVVNYDQFLEISESRQPDVIRP